MWGRIIRTIYAHSLADRPESEWEPLADHLDQVGKLAGLFAKSFGAEALGEVAGRLHDIGKVSSAFQAYIMGNGAARGPDHSTAGALEAMALYGKALGRILAYGIAGHHAGLADGAGDHVPGTLSYRLNGQYRRIEDYAGWQDHAGPLTKAIAPPPAWRSPMQARGFPAYFFIRMLFSALVDADFLATDAFYAQARGEPVVRGCVNSLETLQARLNKRLAAIAKSDTEVNRLRGDILAYVRDQASLAPGFFSLTVPTGGGKTLTSLAFALDHAIAHGLDRIIYVIPYTSIIEQTADVFRSAVGDDGDVLEHHSAVEWDPHADDNMDDEGREGLKKLRRAAESWDVRIIVTTSVQFFESLFAARTSACRKLHNVAKSVIILDEAQNLPLGLLRPCMAAMEALVTGYGASLVLCTATQPALSEQDDFKDGLKNVRELAPDPQDLHAQLKRVRVELVPEPVGDQQLAEELQAAEQILCIVNTRAHARDLFDRIKDAPGARHLTTLMCPLHRRAALAEIRQDLKDEKPVRLIATSLIEAGVDVDFPTVWRAVAGLDSIAQAAGRCNREGRLAQGVVHVFRPDETEHQVTPGEMQQLVGVTNEVLRHHEGDPIGLDALRAYFQQLYWSRDGDGLDKTYLGEGPQRRQGILKAIAEGADALNFPYAQIAREFRFIKDRMQPVIMPYQAKNEAEPVRDLAERLRHIDRPGALARKLALYSVPVPRHEVMRLIADGAAEYIAPDKYGDQFILLTNEDIYSEEAGLDWSDPTFRKEMAW